MIRLFVLGTLCLFNTRLAAVAAEDHDSIVNNSRDSNSGNINNKDRNKDSVSDDPAVVAAQRALAAGQPVQVVMVLRDHPGLARCGDERLLLAEAYLLLGRGDDAAATLDTSHASDDLSEWPEPLRGRAAETIGQAMLATGVASIASESVASATEVNVRFASETRAARRRLEQALRLRQGVSIDHVLVLLIDVCERLSDRVASEQYARLVWRDWPRSPHRGHAGLRLAQFTSERDPEDARAVLASVRRCDGLSDADRLSAAELLCALLLSDQPGACLVIAEQETRRLRDCGRLPLFHALAVAALDERAGTAALASLPAPLHDDPAVAATYARLGRRSDDAAAQRHHAIEWARAEAELGRTAEAQARLAPFITDDGEALALLLTISTPDPAQLRAFSGCPATQSPTGALALARALLLSGQKSAAWLLLQPFSTRTDLPQAQQRALWYWGAQAALDIDPLVAERMRQQLLADIEHGIEVGLVWCDEAQRRERQGSDAQPAWERAAHELPIEHPWRATAAWHAARSLITRRERLADALNFLREPAWAGSTEEHLRCRFLLAQTLELTGENSEALHVAESLLALADEGQRQRLETLIARLHQAVTAPR